MLNTSAKHFPINPALLNKPNHLKPHSLNKLVDTITEHKKGRQLPAFFHIEPFLVTNYNLFRHAELYQGLVAQFRAWHEAALIKQ